MALGDQAAMLLAAGPPEGLRGLRADVPADRGDAQFLRLKSRRGPKKAILAVAASILTAAYYILKDDVAYHELGADYFERRDKAQITRRLIRRLEQLGLSVEVSPAA